MPWTGRPQVFVVTIRRIGRPPLIILHCMPMDLVRTLLRRAMALDKDFNQGVRTRVTFSVDDQDPKVDERCKPLTLIVFHPSVETMQLWEVGLSITNSIISVEQHLRG